MGKLDLNRSNWVMFRNFGEIEFQINKSIFWEKIGCWFIFWFKVFETIDSFSNLEFIKFNKSNSFIFLFGDKFSFSEDVFFVWDEFFQRLGSLWCNLGFSLFDLNWGNLGWLLRLLDSLGWLFFTHDEIDILFNKVVVDWYYNKVFYKSSKNYIHNIDRMNLWIFNKFWKWVILHKGFVYNKAI